MPIITFCIFIVDYLFIINWKIRFQIHFELSKIKTNNFKINDLIKFIEMTINYFVNRKIKLLLVIMKIDLLNVVMTHKQIVFSKNKIYINSKKFPSVGKLQCHSSPLVKVINRLKTSSNYLLFAQLRSTVCVCVNY